MTYVIEQPKPADATRLVEVWEAAVRASHDFLDEMDIQLLKPLLIEQYFPQVALYVIRRDDGQVAGFMGYTEGQVEMLFVHPEQHGQGLGRALLNYATQELGAYLVDVNEQNPKALAFYLSQGFKVARRSPLDGGGRPFPILHLQLDKPAP
ncbi:GNAT family N-acetyltransferase [Pseudomonas sp. 5P_3.1_Bac2]|uniref:GNAT family N-acetyltransferase n=1 Tax=Pseudomonas sp. 5P_3.1_Bac2 TaxID=2971617 RepID=UPI0021C9AF4F|nr:GNAT family N-acetyltransferase [Pseudomonas sp. 5P_3.1_Bac2]MCU1718079.1 GNAT family N-acetyltransferase [Pseudomonas sp. 5P_3.1_Bac2]